MAQPEGTGGEDDRKAPAPGKHSELIAFADTRATSFAVAVPICILAQGRPRHRSSKPASHKAQIGLALLVSTIRASSLPVMVDITLAAGAPPKPAAVSGDVISAVGHRTKALRASLRQAGTSGEGGVLVAEGQVR
jgi:hypothetical protein